MPQEGTAMQNALMQMLGCEHPVIQAPMAGGADTPELVAAVGNAGGFGFIGAAYLTPEQIVDSAQRVRALTPRRFGINLFAPLPAPPEQNLSAAIARLAPYHMELGLPPPAAPQVPADPFDAQLAAALESGSSAISFTFGLLPKAAVMAIHARGIAAALALGAGAVQLGTAFLTCSEAGVAEVYKDAILGSPETATRITRAFSGRPARGIVNRFMTGIDADADAIAPFPVQNVMTRPLRRAAAKQGRAEFLSLWAGQGVRLARRQTAAALIERLCREIQRAIASLPQG